ncbi:DUF2441 domain-containing protein [Salmonella enterica subsp. enterica serovar Newport]|uniref:DUF2441 domain-containing protein n=1 Tax=Salmonella enterica I TaxID=59201 RepID=A0A3V2NZ88_SALET|nr:DUF2441 domain-containing protein [Salmonella enterica subsp. enterica serovar Newport]EBX0576192.1 DUF2441 domain-containing protein [Salmonella enterica subsp. enterica serovar Utah]ECR9668830.1 DUF2441 domain-containing protein [Salmonella enterica]EEC4937668.1 DUF2441 domain-containing protein [Salmonella enterica subsp. enterica serovar Kasenyi]EBR9097408.1 DUF2441 domain-containing protein [Salmonella enterica subsp. enterica serovar Newport]
MSIVLYSADRRGRYNTNALMEFSSIVPSVTDSYVVDSLIGAEFDFKIAEHGLRYLFPRRDLNGTDLMELIVELVRRLQFPTKPSRYQSIFACDKIEDANYFRENHREHDGPQPIYEILVGDNTNIHRGDMRLLDLNPSTDNAAIVFTKAIWYWSGIASREPFWEYVIPLPAQIGKIIME